ncbi:MAG: hypothetical protein LBG12_06260 [Synergistaceae bacterium]|jgi:uncharacterized membrane protein YcgQ (UPF0703/DUF1980 family)|nr:hypothetical protein [Synergistaceae bacterium]
MKKLLLFVVILCLLPVASFAGDIVEIKEKMFVAQTNDVYINPDEYLGRTIKLEGMFGLDTEMSPPLYYVFRYGPGCCGYDANAGFEVVWKDEKTAYPNENDWVEAAGVLENYDEDGEPYLRLALTSLTVKAERGLERVEQ